MTFVLFLNGKIIVYKIVFTVLILGFMSCYESKISNSYEIDSKIFSMLKKLQPQIEGNDNLYNLFGYGITINARNYSDYFQLSDNEKQYMSELFEAKSIININARGKGCSCIEFLLKSESTNSYLEKSYERLYIVYYGKNANQTCLTNRDDEVIETKLIEQNWYLIKSKAYLRVR